MAIGVLTAQQRRQLEVRLAGLLPGGVAEAGPRPAPDGRPATLPLSSAQQRIWFFHRLDPTSTLYNVVGTARLRGRLDTAALRGCLDEVVRRHEILRTTYGLRDGEPVQVVHEPAGLPLPVQDLSRTTGAERESALRELLRREAGLPFDLARDPALRPLLIRLADDDHLLLLSQHHISADGWSLGVLLREFGELYRAFARNEPSPLPEPALQYADFTLWQRGRSQAREAEQKRFWEKSLADAKPLELAGDLCPPATRTWNGETIEFRLERGLVDELRQLAGSVRGTLFMALLAAFGTIGARWSEQADFVLGTPVAHRSHPATESMLGCFINALPLRVAVREEQSFRQLIERLRETCLAAYANEDVPFEQIVQAVNPERDARSRTPLVRHMIGLHNTPRPELDLPGLEVELGTLSTGMARFDLELEFSPGAGGRLDGALHFATDLFSRGMAEGLISAFRAVLEQAARRPDAPVADHRLVPGADDGRLTVPRPAPASRADAELPLHRLVEQTARRRPDAVAAAGEGFQLSYRDLEQQARSVAELLQAAGAKPGDLVELAVTEPRALPAAVLGIWRAGCAAAPSGAPGEPPARPFLLEHVPGAGGGAAGPRVRVRGPVPTAREGAEAPERAGREVSPEDPALVLTDADRAGGPQEVLLSHRRIAEALERLDAVLGPGADQAVLLRSPLWDSAVVLELIRPLVAGGTAVVADPARRHDAAHLAELMRRHRVAVCRFGPAALSAFLDHQRASAGYDGSPLTVLVTGDGLTPALAGRFWQRFPEAVLAPAHSLAAAAGPVAANPLRAADPGASLTGTTGRIPVGRPLPGVGLSIHDRHGHAVATGVAGLVRFALPARSPSGDRGDELPTAGDRARRLPGGELELLSRDSGRPTPALRTDQADAVLAALAAHPMVDRALLAPAEGHEPNPASSAYVSVREPDGDPAELRRASFTEVYVARAAAKVPGYNLSGWNSGYTGRYVSAQDMRAWQSGTVGRVLAFEPEHVLEIGCGNGTLLFRIAPRCVSYCAVDVSDRALEHIQENQGRLALKASRLRLLKRAADELDDLPDETFDTVVVNSLTHYFPDAEYLRAVLVGALRLVRPGGRVFLGDVRSLPLLEALHCSTLLDALPAGASVAELAALAAHQAAQEDELAVAPGFFTALEGELAGLARVEVLPKREPGRNELTQFRYDVVLHRGSPDRAGDGADALPSPGTACGPLSWASAGEPGLAGLRELLSTSPAGVVELRAFPDARVHAETAVWNAARSGSTDPAGLRVLAAAPAPVPGLDAVEDAARGWGWTTRATLGPDCPPGHLDLRFTRDDGAVRAGTAAPAAAPAGAATGATGATGATANSPMRTRAARAAVPLIRAHLLDRLPESLHPAVTPVVRWPLLEDDRIAVDRLAQSPAQPSGALDAAPWQEPRNPTEREVAAIWADVLGVESVGVNEDFFALGGHSLMGTMVVDRIEASFAVNLPLARLFESSTVAAVADFIEEQRAQPAEAAAPAPILRIDRTRRRAGSPEASADD